MTSDETLELLQAAVALRLEGRKVPESIRRALAHTEEALLRVIGPLVRKRVAAQLLGCSVQALDRWIAKGAIRTEPIAEGSTRTAIPTEPLVAIASEFALLEDDATLGAAVAAWRARRVRHFEIRDANQLNIDLHVLAQAARRRNA